MKETIERIEKMEAKFDELKRAFKASPHSLHSDLTLEEMLAALVAYYEDGRWLSDYELDEKGLLPKDLKRGILSQDALYEFLNELKEVETPMVLFINGCVRENSRSFELAQTVLSKESGHIEEVCLLKEQPKGLDRDTLAHRDSLLSLGEHSHPMFRWANQFKQADIIVIAAPYWDMLFPAMLRSYLERICVVGITFRYDENDRPVSLCRAKRLIYVTTAGGPVIHNLGYEYVETLAKEFFGIEDCRCVMAEGLDLRGADAAAILRKAKEDYLNS